MHKKGDFKSLLNKKFKITFDSENSYEVELVKIIEGSPIPELNSEPFSLLFRGGPNEKIFAQRNYTVHSDVLGEIDMFLMPRRPDNEGVYYEVVYN